MSTFILVSLAVVSAPETQKDILKFKKRIMSTGVTVIYLPRAAFCLENKLRALISSAACSGEISVFSDILIFLFGVKLDID